ncbi:MAG TPA: hypothetical protein VF263_23455, partial [Longimicrobiaceae bacterium]
MAEFRKPRRTGTGGRPPRRDDGDAPRAPRPRAPGGAEELLQMAEELEEQGRALLERARRLQ